MAEITLNEAMVKYGLTKNKVYRLVSVDRGRLDEDLLVRELEAVTERAPSQSLQRAKRELSTYGNTIKVIAACPELIGAYYYDQFADQITCVKNPEAPAGIPTPVFERTPRPMCDADVSVVIYWCEAAGFSPQPAMVERCIRDYASSRAVHPVRDYLQSLQWDGTPRLTGWLTTYMGVKFDTYSAMVGRYWLVSAVARVMEPGCQADHVLILEGPQGVGKSTLTRILAVNQRWHFDGQVNMGNKETPMLLQGKWIVEFQELGGMRRQEGEKIKEFFTQHTDKYVKKYSNLETVFPRQCVFVATVNHNQYLQDDTGNRRFWPVIVKRLEKEKLERDVDQLWAEAYAIYKAGETCPDCILPNRCDNHRWWPSVDEQSMWFSEEQSKRVPDDLWSASVDKWMIHYGRQLRTARTTQNALGRWPTTSEVLTGALEIATQEQNKLHEVRVSRVLRQLGYEANRRRVDTGVGPGVRLYVWEPTEATQAIIAMAEERES